MSFTSKNICAKDPSTFYIPMDNDSQLPTGYCLCPRGSGIFDHNSDNTGNKKCSKDLLYNGVRTSLYFGNESITDKNFKYTNQCDDEYTRKSLTGYKDYFKCVATKCPPGWTLNVVGSSSNCSRMVGTSSTPKVFPLDTFGYIAVPPGFTPKREKAVESTPSYTMSNEPLYRILKIVLYTFVAVCLIAIVWFIYSLLTAGNGNEIQVSDTAITESSIVVPETEPILEEPVYEPVDEYISEPYPTVPELPQTITELPAPEPIVQVPAPAPVPEPIVQVPAPAPVPAPAEQNVQAPAPTEPMIQASEKPEINTEVQDERLKQMFPPQQGVSSPFRGGKKFRR